MAVGVRARVQVGAAVGQNNNINIRVTSDRIYISKQGPLFHRSSRLVLSRLSVHHLRVILRVRLDHFDISYC